MEPENDGTKPDYNEAGVDLSMIRWFLSLTPAERLQVLENHDEDLRELLALNDGR